MDYILYEKLMNDPSIFKGLSLKQRNDKELAMNAIYYESSLFNCIGKELQNNDDFLIELLGNCSTVFEYYPHEKKDNFKICKQAILFDPNNLEFVSTRLKDNKSLVYYAVKKDSTMIEFASSNIQEFVGDGNPCDMLMKMIKIEKLAIDLNNKLEEKINNKRVKL